MGYSLGQAAKAAGISKTSISRAIKSGRLSATRTNGGGYEIDPAELHRAYPATGNGAGHLERSVTLALPDAGLVQLRGERDQFRGLAEERDRTIAQQHETIRDLRDRLDASEAERRQLSERLHGLLTHSRSAAADQPIASEQQPDGSAGDPALEVADARTAASIAATEAAGLRGELDRLRLPSPWWRRWFR